MAYVNGNWIETTSSGYGVAPRREDDRYTGGIGPAGLIAPGLMNLWKLGREKGWFSLNPREAIEKRKEKERAEQIKRLQRSQDRVAHGYPQAFKRKEWEQPVPTREPEVEEDDDMKKLLSYLFIRDIIGGTAGGDPPTPYTVRAGPAAREFPTMPSMFV